MKDYPNTPCHHPQRPSLEVGKINYTAEQINALLDLIPLKVGREDLNQLINFTSDNFIGHYPDASMLTDQKSFAWAFVGDLAAAVPYFHYMDGYAPKGYAPGWNNMQHIFGTYPLFTDNREDQLTAEELFKVPFRLPELTAHRALADEHGNRIPDTYVTRQGLTEHIRATYNKQFLENPPLITEGYITPQMLSEETRQMLEATGQKITNLPDGEDLQTVHGVLKLANKEYNPGAYSGLGRQYLRKNIVAGRNVLTQSMINKPNTIYIIQYDYDLQGVEITIPEGCVLDFQGGSLNNGIIKFKNTIIKNQHPKCLYNISVYGTLLNKVIYVTTFGIGTGMVDDNPLINQLSNCMNKGGEIVFDSDLDYNLNTDSSHLDVEFKDGLTYSFTGKGYLKVNNYTGSGTVAVTHGSEIVINNIKIDGNNVNAGGSGTNGLSISGHNITINGGIIKNCAKGETEYHPEMSNTSAWNGWYMGDGGKGVQIEAYNNKNIIVNDLYVENCFFGISVNNSYDSSTEEGKIGQNAVFNNLYCKDCSHFGIFALINTADRNPNMQNVVLNGFVSEDCGYYVASGDEEYTEDKKIKGKFIKEGGVFVFNRATNILCTNGKIIGNKKVKNIFVGAIHDSQLNNIIIKQTCDNIIEIAPTVYGLSHENPSKNIYRIIINGVYKYLVNNSINNTNLLKNNIIEAVCNSIPTSESGEENTLLSYTALHDNSNIASIYHPDTSAIYNGSLYSFMLFPYYNKISNITEENNNKIFPHNQFQNVPKTLGNTFFDKDIKKQLWYNGEFWGEYDGSNAWISRAGGRVIMLNTANVKKKEGFVFFNTERNVPFFWDGEYWVDALGRVVKEGYERENELGIYDNRPNKSLAGVPYIAADKTAPEAYGDPRRCLYYNDEDMGVVLFNTGNDVWIDAFGRQYTKDTPIIRTYGLFNEKPLNQKIGFSYFCTDRQTVEGTTDGIMIYHKGNNVWVDALGRVVE